MDTVSISLDVSVLGRQLTTIEEQQLPFAGAQALNATAYDALKHIQGRMDVVFDRPTRFTKNALMVWRADKKTLEAQVKERPSVGRRHYLKVQEAGGPRPQTGLERLFNTRMAYEGHIQSVMPAANALLDQAGNWRVGERNRVLSDVRAQSDKQTNSSRASVKRRGKTSQFFVPKAGSKLSPGVWKRTSKGAQLQKVVHFSEQVPTYKPRLGFYDGVADVWNTRLPVHLSDWLEKAVASAKI